MKYRKKPVVIEAFQWTGDEKQTEDPKWIVDAMKAGIVKVKYPILQINTLEGLMSAQPGDWIIRGISGEIYPCKPKIFENSYDLAEET